MTAGSSSMAESKTDKQVSRENCCDCLHWLGGTESVAVTVPTCSASMERGSW